jgi:crotonobetainyl-CoA:carnitine CoA-transferase CaiB-like acyl-CoA transferase
MQDLKTDEQLAYREHFHKLDHPILGEHVVEAAGMRFSESPMVFDRAAPCLAADNEQVYCGVLGLSKSELEELVEAGVLG